jgi:acyl phosphate:glycerol-3-phosphate acyltransferase
MLETILGIIISYVIGSFPTAYVFGKLYKGIDIRQHGSGNMGATNAFRVLGKVPGIIILVIDILKGVIATSIVGDLLGLTRVISRMLLGVAVVCGHNWTVFLGFRGGKGIATSLGVLIGLTIELPVLQPVLLVCLGAWTIVFLITGYVSVASIIAAIILPLGMYFSHQSTEMLFLGVTFCIFVIVRHKINIKRLLSGQESRANWPFKRS